MLIRQLLLERYAPLYQLSDRTKVLYGHTLDRFDEFLGRPGTLDDLDDVVVSQFLAHRLTDPKRPVRRTTVLKDRVQLCAIANYAAKKRLIPEFLTLKPMRAAGRLPQAYLPDDVHRLLDVCRHLPGLEAGLPRAWWWSTHLGVFVETAGRIGEIKVLCWRHVDRDRQVVLYEAESRKGKTRDIERGISSGLAELLEQHRGAPEAPVWPWVLGNEMRYHRLRQLCKKAGVTYRGFHSFRKTAASVVAAQGGSAQQLLDHDRASTSERHYLDNRIVGRRVSAAEALGLRFALPDTAPEQSPHTP